MRNEIVANALRRRLAEVRSSIVAGTDSGPTGGTADVEETLRRLMVNDRAKIERREKAEMTGVFDRLDMIAEYAVSSPDLRYLDALNYYYELPIGFPDPTLVRYSEALTAHIERLCA